MDLSKLGYLEPGMKVRINGKVCRIKEQCNVYAEGTKYRWSHATGDFSEFYTHLCFLGYVEATNATFVGSSLVDDEGNEIRDYRINAETPSVFVFEGTMEGLEELVEGLSVTEVGALVTHYNDDRYFAKFKGTVERFKAKEISVSEFKEEVDIDSLVKNLGEFEVKYLKYGVDF